ncbi:hypothetical protein GJ496_008211 [Pomphorhynchus laevis]|nr:hypothetical protein GJ496_008211 [Pomphorhynchus laevis]
MPQLNKKVILCHREKRKLKRAFKSRKAKMLSDNNFKESTLTFKKYCNKKLRSLQNRHDSYQPDAHDESDNKSARQNVKIKRKGSRSGKDYIYKDRILKQYTNSKNMDQKLKKQMQSMRLSMNSKNTDNDDEVIGKLSKLLGITCENQQRGGFHYDGLTDLLDVCANEDSADLEVGSAWIKNDEHFTVVNADSQETSNNDINTTSEVVITPKLRRKAKLKIKTNKYTNDVSVSNNRESRTEIETHNLSMSNSNENKQSDDNTGLIKRLRALFNRLNASNLCWALKEFQHVHSNSTTSRYSLRLQLWSCLYSSALSEDKKLAPDIMLLEHAAFISLINAQVDQQIGSFVLNKMCVSNLDLCIVRFASSLCSFKVVTSDLIISMIKQAAFATPDNGSQLAEMCIGTSRICPQLKKHKEFKTLVKSFITRYGDNSQRCRILLEESLKKTKNDDGHSSILKIVQGICTQPLTSFTCSASYSELKKTYFTNELCSGGGHCDSFKMAKKSISKDRIIAKRLGMNTQLRSAILAEILKSEDYSEATGLLLQLKITKSQRPEIINVLMSLMFKEKSFNLFYVLTINKLCNVNKMFLETVRQRTWEKLKDLPRKSDFLENFVSFLIIKGTLNLTILKAVSFATMNETTMNTVRDILLQLFDEGKEQILGMFIDIAKRLKQRQFCNCLRLFIEQFIMRFAGSSIISDKVKNPTEVFKLCEKVIVIMSTADSLCLED